MLIILLNIMNSLVTFWLTFGSIDNFSDKNDDKEVTKESPHFPVHYYPIPKWFPFIFLFFLTSFFRWFFLK